MVGILKLFGSLSIVLGVIAAFVGCLFSGVPGGFWIALTVALPLIVTGAVFHSFGAIVEHLAAIRTQAEYQTRFLETMSAQVTPRPAAEPVRHSKAALYTTCKNPITPERSRRGKWAPRYTRMLVGNHG